MRRTTGRWLVLGALIAIGAVEVGAQDQEVPQRRGRGLGPDVEAIMQLRERLELTEDQIAELDVIRREAVERRTGEMAEMTELRSQLRAGQIRRSEVMAYMEERRDANQGLAEERRARIESILTEDQLAALDEIQLRRRAFRRGRQSARRGPRGGFDDGPAAGGARRPRRSPALDRGLDRLEPASDAAASRGRQSWRTEPDD